MTARCVLEFDHVRTAVSLRRHSRLDVSVLYAAVLRDREDVTIGKQYVQQD